MDDCWSRCWTFRWNRRWRPATSPSIHRLCGSRTASSCRCAPAPTASTSRRTSWPTGATRTRGSTTAASSTSPTWSACASTTRRCSSSRTPSSSTSSATAASRACASTTSTACATRSATSAASATPSAPTSPSGSRRSSAPTSSSPVLARRGHDGLRAGGGGLDALIDPAGLQVLESRTARQLSNAVRRSVQLQQARGARPTCWPRTSSASPLLQPLGREPIAAPELSTRPWRCPSTGHMSARRRPTVSDRALLAEPCPTRSCGPPCCSSCRARRTARCASSS